MKREKEQELWGRGEVENRTGGISDTYFYFAMLFGAKRFIFFIYFLISCLLLSVDILLSLTSSQYLNITSKLHHCPGCPSCDFPNFQMQAWHVKIDLMSIFELDGAQLCFSSTRSLTCFAFSSLDIASILQITKAGTTKVILGGAFSQYIHT